jgi:threonine aldolase
MRSRLSQDHKNARLLGKWLGQIEGITVSPKQIQTNMVFCKMDYKPPLTPEMILARMASAGIITNPPEEDVWRFVTHIDIREKDVLHTVNVIKGILTKDYW